MTLKPYLVDVPLKFNIWIRPECQKQQMREICKARPSKLFIVSDGGRNEREWEAIQANRKLVDSSIDWDCEIVRLYADHNQGLYHTEMQAYETIFSQVDRCCFLEDDTIPSVSWFRFCADLLEKYKDDQRINMICGMNHLGNYTRPSSDYFFSRMGSVWGCASWKRVYDQYYDFSYGKDPYIMDLLQHETAKHPSFQKKINAYAENEYYQGHKAFEEFFTEFGLYAQHQLFIVSSRNLVTNIGATADSAHFTEMNQVPKKLRGLFNMKRYELNFPLKDPKYVIPDYYYEKKVHEIMADEGAWNKTERFLEYKYLYLKNGGSLSDGIKKVIKRRMHQNQELEK